MKKLRLNTDDVQVETFTVLAEDARQGTIHGHSGGLGGDTCYGCTNWDDLCSGPCTGIGVECYTADQAHAACTGGNPCTGPAACTRGTCLSYWPEDETC